MRRVASVERTAYPRFKRTISSRELHEGFTPGTAEVAWARGKARSPEHLLALVVLLKSYQKLGYFPDLGRPGRSLQRRFGRPCRPRTTQPT